MAAHDEGTACAVERSGAQTRRNVRVLCWDWWRQWLIKHFLPIGFGVAVLLGLSVPWLGCTVSSWKVRGHRIVPTANLVTVFLVSGVMLKTKDVAFALKAPSSFIFGMLSILALTPLLGLAMKEIPFSVPEFGTGLAIFCAVPTTLAAGVSLVKVAAGNWTLALLLCVCSNAAAVATVPLTLKLLLTSTADGASVHLNATGLLLSLVLTIVAPLCVAKVARDNCPPLRALGHEHQTTLSLISNTSLILIVWQSVSRAQEEVMAAPLAQVTLLLLACVGLHVVLLLLNASCVLLLRLPVADQKAVVIMASQKTLPVALAVISFLPSETFGRDGLLTIPCILGHILQIGIDSVLAARMAEHSNEPPEAAAAAASTYAVHAVPDASEGVVKVPLRCDEAPVSCAPFPPPKTLQVNSVSTPSCPECLEHTGLNPDAVDSFTSLENSGSMPLGSSHSQHRAMSSWGSGGGVSGIALHAGTPHGSNSSTPRRGGGLAGAAVPHQLCWQNAPQLFEKPTAFDV